MLYTYYYWSEEYQTVVQQCLLARNRDEALHVIQDRFNNKEICFTCLEFTDKVNESGITRIAKNKNEILLVDPNGKPCLLKTN